MSWSTIRRATDTDKEAIAAAAERFCKRHGIDVLTEHETPEFAINCALNPGNGAGYEYVDRARHLRPLWKRIVRRILGNNADGIAYGYVGYHVE